MFREIQQRNVKPDRTILQLLHLVPAGMELLEAGKLVHAIYRRAAFHNSKYVASVDIGT